MPILISLISVGHTREAVDKMLDIVQQAVREEADGRSTGSREEGSGEEVNFHNLLIPDKYIVC